MLCLDHSTFFFFFSFWLPSLPTFSYPFITFPTKYIIGRSYDITYYILHVPAREPVCNNCYNRIQRGRRKTSSGREWKSQTWWNEKKKEDMIIEWIVHELKEDVCVFFFFSLLSFDLFSFFFSLVLRIRSISMIV